MKIILVPLLLVLVILLGVFFYTWYRLHKSFDLHVSANIDYVNKYPISYKQRYFTTSDGIKIASWYIPVKNPKDLWVANSPHDMYENNPLAFQKHVLNFLKLFNSY